MLWMGFVACMSLFFGGAAWNGFTLSALYCQRDELQVIRCEIGTALLGVPEWERREPLPGELLSTRIATHRGSRSTSYAIELNTTEASMDWGHNGSSFTSQQTRASKIKAFMDSNANHFELHETLDTFGLVTVTGLLALPFFSGFLIRIEQLTLDTEARTIRSLQRGMWQHEDKTLALANLREVRINQKKGSRNSTVYSLVLSFEDDESVSISNVDNKQAQAAKKRIEAWLKK